MANFNLSLTDDQKDEVVVNVLLKDFLSFQGHLKSKYPNPDDIKISDAIKTLLSSWYMTPEAFDNVVGNSKDDEDTKEDAEKYYWIEPMNGWKWGFPKKISHKSYLDDTIEWLVKNGYPKDEIEKLGRHFTWTIWRRPEETEGTKK